jgi:cyclopropane fatty-acyl-phospholipid synthase-like methyltransferase
MPKAAAELRAVVENGRVQPGRALDLGCGTGTNVIYLAEHGFDAFGVDISSRAVATTRRKIAQAGHAQKAHVYAGDVTRLEFSGRMATRSSLWPRPTGPKKSLSLLAPTFWW